jgi:hypothetical protein
MTQTSRGARSRSTSPCLKKLTNRQSLVPAKVCTSKARKLSTTFLSDLLTAPPLRLRLNDFFLFFGSFGLDDFFIPRVAFLLLDYEYFCQLLL